MIKENQKYLNRLVVFLDGFCIVFSLLFAWYFRFESGVMKVADAYLSLNAYLKPVFIITPVYLLIYNSFNLYIPHRTKSIFEEFLNIVKANMLGFLIFVVLLYFFKEMDYSRYLLFIFIITCITTTWVERSILRVFLHKIRKKGYNLKHILILGYSELTTEFLKRLRRNRRWGYQVVGILDDGDVTGSRSAKRSELRAGGEKYGLSVIEREALEELAAGIQNEGIIGKLGELDYYLNEFHIDEVFITLETKEYDKLGPIIASCEKAGVRTQVIPDYYKYIPAKPYVEEIDGLPVINIRYVPLDNLLNRAGKRLFDLFSSLCCILLFSPIMLLTAAIIKITSPGPVIFKQERVGMNRKNFTMYKFRSMHIQKKEEEKCQWTTCNDPRKTKFGSFIRKTSIDELPQLFNVLRGEMSLVGPRPERPHFVEKFKEEVPKYMIKHQVRPGITGWAQVNGYRGDTSIVKRIEHDIYYIENWNFLLDVKILWSTVFKGFVNKNAY